MPLTKIVSGGQSGVDRGALDAALAARFACGGWCPPGRLAEDGQIPARYPVTEMPKGGYRERTIQNVIDSDGTLIIYFGQLRGGTEQTLLHCARRQKPYKLIDGGEVTPRRAGQLAAAFVTQHNIAILNVAGPRSSQNPGAYAYAVDVIAELLGQGSQPSR